MEKYTVRTERLLLRPMTVEDAEAVFKWVSDERVTRYMCYTTYTDIGAVRDWLASEKDNQFLFGYERLSDGELIGSGSIEPDENGVWVLGYNLRCDCWGMGYATEAAQGMIRFAKETFGAEKIRSSHCEPNLASGRVMQKCGLHFVGYGHFTKLDGSCLMRSVLYQNY